MPPGQGPQHVVLYQKPLLSPCSEVCSDHFPADNFCIPHLWNKVNISFNMLLNPFWPAFLTFPLSFSAISCVYCDLSHHHRPLPSAPWTPKKPCLVPPLPCHLQSPWRLRLNVTSSVKPPASLGRSKMRHLFWVIMYPVVPWLYTFFKLCDVLEYLSPLIESESSSGAGVALLLFS